MAETVLVVLFLTLFLVACGTKSSPPPRTESTKVRLDLKDGSRVEGVLVHRDDSSYYIEVAGKRLEIPRKEVANSEGLNRSTRSSTGGSSSGVTSTSPTGTSSTGGSSTGGSYGGGTTTGTSPGGNLRVETDPVTGNPRIVGAPSLTPSLPSIHIPKVRIEERKAVPVVQPPVVVQPRVQAAEPVRAVKTDQDRESK